MGLPVPGYALLETKGRKTGKPRRTPVGDGRIGNQFWLVAEHGMKAGYVRNIERDPDVRLKVRKGLGIAGTRALHICSWNTIHVSANAGWRLNCRQWRNARAVRLFATQLLSIRIDLGN